MYKLDLNTVRKSVRVHEFREPNISWLDFVINNRMLLDRSDYDIIIGPTADANAQKLVDSFYNNYGNKATTKQKEELLIKIKPKVYGRQICCRSNKAIAYLEFVGVKEQV